MVDQGDTLLDEANSLVKQITGRVEMRPLERDADGYVVDARFEWIGGDVVGITQDLLREADPRWLKREGAMISAGPFDLLVIAENERLVLAKRILEV